MTGTNRGDAASWFDRQRNRIEQQRRDILGEISGERAFSSHAGTRGGRPF